MNTKLRGLVLLAGSFIAIYAGYHGESGGEYSAYPYARGASTRSHYGHHGASFAGGNRMSGYNPGRVMYKFGYRGGWRGRGLNGGSLMGGISGANIQKYYQGNYPYWGYDLGFEESLVPLVQKERWAEIEAMLVERLNLLNAELVKMQHSGDTDTPSMQALQDQIEKVKLHLDLLSSRATG